MIREMTVLAVGRPPSLGPSWTPAALAVATLDPSGCRWPCGEVADDTFRFCNARRRTGSYCGPHGLRARRGAHA